MHNLLVGVFTFLLSLLGGSQQTQHIAAHVVATPTPEENCSNISSWLTYSPVVKQALLLERKCIAPTPIPSISQPHEGLKESKGMSCQPIGNNGQMNCQEYDTWYDPNATPEPRPSNTLQ